jgi:hypothetical protein
MKAVGEKVNKAEVYTKKETIDKINELNTKIYNAKAKQGGFVKNFTLNPEISQ